MRTLALAFFLLTAQAARGAASLEGTVVVQEGSGAVAVPGVYVRAKAGSPERVVTQARTDSQGRYLLQDIPPGRVTLRVEAAGYYTLKAGPLDSETITQTCPETGECGQVDFVVARAAVLEGWLVDDFGEPVDSVVVDLTPSSGPPPPPGPRRLRVAHRSMSDDRGYFRMWGIRPGRYLLDIDTTVPRFPPWGPQFEFEGREIEIAGGEKPLEVRLELQGEAEVYSISGTIENLREDNLTRTSIDIQPVLAKGSSYSLPRRSLGSWRSWVRDKKFHVYGLRKGEYLIRLRYWQEGSEPEMRLLTRLQVSRDLTGLRLRAADPTGVRGRVHFDSGERSDLVLTIRPAEGSLGLSIDRLEVRGPEYFFESTGLPPGEYVVSVSPLDYFLADDRFRVQANLMTELEMTASSEFATVRGSVRVAGQNDGQERSAASHFLVALRGSRGLHTSAADENGSFVFEKIIPGEYEIAAWGDPKTVVADEQAWDSRRTAVRTVTVEGGFEVDVDLTVEP